MSVSVIFLPILILAALALGVLVYYICYKAAINRKLRAEESGAHVPMASMESVWKVVAVIAVFVMFSSLSSKITNLQNELNNTVRQLVANLPEKYRMSIYLYYSANMSVREIAEMLHMPEGTVKSRMSKARTLLKNELEVLGYDR